MQAIAMGERESFAAGAAGEEGVVAKVEVVATLLSSFKVF
jgi:hypothetical protein